MGQDVWLRMDQNTREYTLVAKWGNLSDYHNFEIHTIFIISVIENINPAKLLRFWLAPWSTVLCWKSTVTQVTLLWWSNGETRRSDIHGIYVTPKTKFQTILNTFYISVFFYYWAPDGVTYAIYVTPAPYILQRVTYRIYAVTPSTPWLKPIIACSLIVIQPLLSSNC